MDSSQVKHKSQNNFTLVQFDRVAGASPKVNKCVWSEMRTRGRTGRINGRPLENGGELAFSYLSSQMVDLVGHHLPPDSTIPNTDEGAPCVTVLC